MKKEYVSPCAKTIKIQSKGLLSGSNPQGFEGNLDTTNKITNVNQMLGRDGFYFDEDEE